MDLRFERGIPTDEELAAIVGVLLTRGTAAVEEPPPTSRWAASGRPGGAYGDGRPTRPGPTAWRASTLPR